MVPNAGNSYLDYLEGFFDDCDSTYHCSIGKNILLLTILLYLMKFNQIIGFVKIVLLIE